MYHSKMWKKKGENKMGAENKELDEELEDEHSSATGSVWYHLSFKRGGNRGKVMTMYRGGYSPGLRRYG